MEQNFGQGQRCRHESNATLFLEEGVNHLNVYNILFSQPGSGWEFKLAGEFENGDWNQNLDQFKTQIQSSPYDGQNRLSAESTAQAGR
jgi:hypothetical protein